MDFPPIIIEDEAAAGPSTKSRLVKRLAIAGVSLAVVAVAAGAGYNFLRSSAGATSTAELGALKSTLNTGKSSAASSGVTVAGAMPFSPIVPYGKPTLAKLGNSAYNSQYNSYTFDDTYMNKELRVSEQPLPSGVDSAAPLIDKITASLQAGSKQPVTTNNGQPAYLLANTSVANKQVVVFTTRDMLFFVQSATPHDAIGWTAYLNSFQ